MKNNSQWSWSYTRLNSARLCLQLYDFIYDHQSRLIIEDDINLVIGRVVHDSIRALFQGTGQGVFVSTPGRPFCFRNQYTLVSYAQKYLLEKYLAEADQKAGIFWGFWTKDKVKKRIREVLTNFFQYVSYPPQPITFLESEYAIKNLPLGAGVHFEAHLDGIWRFDDTGKVAIIDYSAGTAPPSRKILQLNLYYWAFVLEAQRNLGFQKKCGAKPNFLYVYQLLTGNLEPIQLTENLESLIEKIKRAGEEITTLSERKTTNTATCAFCLYRNPCKGLAGPAPKKDGIINLVVPRRNSRASGQSHFPGWNTFGVTALQEVKDPLAMQYCGEHQGELMIERRGIMVCPQKIYE